MIYNAYRQDFNFFALPKKWNKERQVKGNPPMPSKVVFPLTIPSCAFEIDWDRVAGLLVHLFSADKSSAVFVGWTVGLYFMFLFGFYHTSNPLQSPHAHKT